VDDYIEHKEPKLLLCDHYGCWAKATIRLPDGWKFCDGHFEDLMAEAEQETEE